ncbi:unnamed protein product [Meloidogyne enterolobii]|uniref:Uncharacterized protein n=1 Tax=Meloidogyne enterolobii TaxID=390850 RepID=A0ACB1AZ72_MELEN
MLLLALPELLDFQNFFRRRQNSPSIPQQQSFPLEPFERPRRYHEEDQYSEHNIAIAEGMPRDQFYAQHRFRRNIKEMNKGYFLKIGGRRRGEISLRGNFGE